MKNLSIPIPALRTKITCLAAALTLAIAFAPSASQAQVIPSGMFTETIVAPLNTAGDVVINCDMRDEGNNRNLIAVTWSDNDPMFPNA